MSRVLRDSLRCADLREPPVCVPERLAEPLATAAAWHGVAGYVRAHIANGHGEAVPRELDAAANAAIAGHVRACGDAEWVGNALGELPWLAFKGPVLTERLHGHPALRGYGDLDVLVPAAALECALSRLERAGARLLVRSWQHVRDHEAGEVTLRLPTGGLLDLHWSLSNRPEHRAAFPEPDLHGAARSVVVAGRSVRTLGAADTLVHLCLHAVLSGCDRLVWIKDIQLALDADHPGWDALVQRARDWQAGLVVATALDRTAALLGATVPRQLPGELAGGAVWPRAVGLASVLSPIERHRGDGSLLRIVARATSRDDRSSARELARRTLAWAGLRPSGVGRAGAAIGDDAAARRAWVVAAEQARAPGSGRATGHAP